MGEIHPINFRGSMDSIYLAVKKFQRGYHNNPERTVYSILMNKFSIVDDAYLSRNREGLIEGVKSILETLAVQ
ncbi:MAG: hypothetical protein PHH54_01285 [Candidatus Nanoarchaeia archaeon]|nr:hypothetical protein [Candidatus Nanoarchaeia archaeon]MDD5740596.1 hypothetical protein [Candidatus Nanoarchaeia archaeon]